MIFRSSLLLASLSAAAGQWRGVGSGVTVEGRDSNTGTSTTPSTTVSLSSPIRSFNGIENFNAENDAELLRMSGTHYPDGQGVGLSMFTEPNARAISNIVAKQPAGLGRNTVSDAFWQWGQFIDHDYALTEGIAEPFQIVTPGCDTTDEICVINMNRALHHFTNGVREQLNEITGFLDASQVYGSSADRAMFLREMTNGRMKMSSDGLLPDGSGSGFANAFPGGLGFIEADLFIGGDIRVNEHIGLLAIHTLWIREHNRIADLLAATYTESSDEDLYQLARKLVTAEINAITYKEFLPLMIGNFAPDVDSYSFSEDVNPGVAHEFSAVAFRVGHTFLSESMLMHNGVSPTGSISLMDAFFDPGMARENPAFIDEILIGQTIQAANLADSFVIEEVRSNLFGAPIAGEGRDLVALNVQRARDHGIPSYNDVRAGFGLPRKQSFSDVSSNADIVARLTEAYGDIDLCDAFICGISEDSVEGGQLGETFSSIIADQFTRSMNGDAHFFVGDPDVRNQDLIARTGIDVDSATLADVINANTVGGVAPNAMRI